MATLLRARDGESFVLGAPTLVGRDEACDLVLRDARVSTHHGRFVYEQGEWHYEDLGSRNGSSVGGRPLQPNQPLRLAQGDALVLGTAAETWTVHRLGPPTLLARSRSGEVATGTDYLSLPDPTEPLATVYQQATGRWVVEGPSGVRPLAHREQLVVGEAVWRVFLPGTLLSTQEDHARQLEVGEILLDFAVSADEEDVVITVEQGGRSIPLKARSHHYLLLTLARERLRDAGREGVPRAEHGWVHQTDLCRMLGLDASVVYLQVHRARRQLEKAGIGRAFDLVERRSGSGQVRIGVASLRVRAQGS